MLHSITCPLCEAMCGLEVKVEEERVVSIRGDEKNPLSRGYICPKGAALQDLHEDKDRLKTPLRRRGTDWEEIDWDTAYDEVAFRLKEVQKKHGRHSVGVFLGNPTVHSSGALLFGLPFLMGLRTRNRFSATSADQLPHMLAALEMFGHQLMVPVPDVDRCDYLVMLGANPVVSGGSLMSAPGFKKRLAALHARGGASVVVDPRRTRTAKAATMHLPIRPGSDALWLASLLHILFDEDSTTLGPLASFTDGLEDLRNLVRPFTPERVSERTQIPAHQTRAVAKDLVTRKKAAVYGRFGISTQKFGGLCSWLINCINIVTGNLDREGGVMFTSPAIDVVDLMAKAGQKGHFAAWHTRGKHLPEFSGELPVSAFLDEMERPGERQIRALVTCAGNPVLSVPGGKRLDRALGKLDFQVSIDPWLNETTRHADLLLPPTGQLERSHFDLIFQVFAVRNTAQYSAAVFEPGPHQRHDWQIFSELNKRMLKGRGVDKISQKMAQKTLGRMGPDRLIDLGLRSGPYGAFRGGMSLGKLRKSPHGVDLGALQPRLPQRLFTPKKRICLVPDLYAQDVERLEKEIHKPALENELVLIGRRQLRSNNSWMHNAKRLAKGKERCTLLVHPDDASDRNLEQGEHVLVRSKKGAVKVPVHISDEVMPGVVSLPHGFGHDKPHVRLHTAALKPGVNVNELTDEEEVDPLSGNACLSGVGVEIERL